MLKVIPAKREVDAYGSGDYGASRDSGKRTHNGIDLKVAAGSYVMSHVTGRVTYLGYPYAKHLEYRYVEVTDDSKFRHRFFYIQPIVELGDEVTDDTIIGVMQDLELIYKDGMTNHLHYEIIDAEGKYIDPSPYLMG